MNNDRRSGRPNRRTAELLLSGSAPAGGHHALRELLDDAAAPARPAELAGEDAAAAAFAAARARPAAAPRARRTALRRFLTVKVSVVAATVLVFGGGVALAAHTGNLPGLDRKPEPSPSPSPVRTDPAGSGRHVNPSTPVSSPQARTSAPVGGDTRRPAPATEPGRSASAPPSHSPARPAAPPSAVPSANPPARGGQASPGRPSVIPTGPKGNATPRSEQAQAQDEPNPRKGPSPRRNRPEQD